MKKSLQKRPNLLAFILCDLYLNFVEPDDSKYYTPDNYKITYMSLKYRPEIDGLRAFAVLPVVFFHAGYETFSGGFIGVDIFFVISGYLITSILINDIANQRFSISNFYERRARRILPALSFVILVSILFAWVLMLPKQMEDFSQSVFFVSVFLSNISFWKEIDYFAPSAEESPLLHTWSLAVEEQYYILFPIFLVLIWRFGRNKVFWTLFCIALASFLLSEWGWRNKPAANFYLAPTRAWELLVGSLGAFLTPSKSRRWNNLFSLLGLSSLALAFYGFSPDTPSPSFYLAAPVLGTLAIIVYAEQDTFVAKFLSIKIFVIVGLLSYSIYLWHQPVFAFGKLFFLDQVVEKYTLLFIVGSLLAAFLSWKYVERPFRNKEKFSRKIIFVYSSVVFSSFATFGIFGHFTSGFKEFLPIPYEVKKIIEHKEQSWDFLSQAYQKDDNYLSVLFIGDSLMYQVADPILANLETSNVKLDLAMEAGCLHLPVILFKSNIDQKACDKSISKVLHNSNTYDYIFIAHSWTGYQGQITCSTPADNCEFKEMMLGLGELIKKLATLSENVIVIGIEPRLTYSQPKFKIQRNSSYSDFLAWQSSFLIDSNRQYLKMIEQMDELINSHESHVIHPVKLFCLNLPEFECDTTNYFFDSRHLTKIGQAEATLRLKVALDGLTF